ncbi:MAG TPA: SRPBCC family protein [Thermoanaerobaculia bacterium]|nr:SRPBCC family protein [Thermoanaerobaculia bacterium]
MSAFDPVRKEIVVDAPAERAFRVFTSRFDKWWPRDHHILEAPLVNVVLEPRAGGRWYEVAADGSECDWGNVLIWDPPRRLLLAWQLDGDWKYDPALITELEIRFIALGPMTTRVELEHRNMERFGGKAAATRATLDSPHGWSTHLGLFAEAAGTEERC